MDFAVVDTGRPVFDDDSVMLSEIRIRAPVALREVSAAVLVADATARVMPLDEQLAALVRMEYKAPVTLVTEKCDSHWIRPTSFG